MINIPGWAVYLGLLAVAGVCVAVPRAGDAMLAAFCLLMTAIMLINGMGLFNEGVSFGSVDPPEDPNG